jgi:F0F1-type ATP synthase membrane subunit b/b'
LAGAECARFSSSNAIGRNRAVRKIVRQREEEAEMKSRESRREVVQQVAADLRKIEEKGRQRVKRKRVDFEDSLEKRGKQTKVEQISKQSTKDSSHITFINLTLPPLPKAKI